MPSSWKHSRGAAPRAGPRARDRRPHRLDLDLRARALRQPLVHLVDRPTDAALDRWFRRATLVVNMSRYEGFGLTVLEALGYGCPTIASDIPAHRELATDAAWLVPPDDADTLATAIVELIEDRDMYIRLSSLARRQAERFTVDAMIRGHLEAYPRSRRRRDLWRNRRNHDRGRGESLGFGRSRVLAVLGQPGPRTLMRPAGPDGWLRSALQCGGGPCSCRSRHEPMPIARRRARLVSVP